MTKHLNIKIAGRVQGIGFRWSAYEKFVELGLQGKAENTQEGLLIDVEGEEAALSQLLEWCRVGPNGAKVTSVNTTEIPEPFVPLKNG